MRKPAVRLVIFLGLISIIGIITLQVYFFQITFNNEERKLNQKIQVALWDVVEQIYDLNNIQYLGKNPVSQVSPDYFVVNVNDFIDAEVLEHYLIRTFEKQNINLDFEYAIYDCQSDKMLFGKYINLSKLEDKPSRIELPKHDEFIYYFGIYFPSRKQHILGSIHSIYILSGILIFVVLFLAYALIVILQQRRFSELQKDVVNNLTHEFKTPLSSIVLSADVLSEKDIVNEPDRIFRYSQIVKTQANTLLQHIEKVLGMSELENTGKLNKKNINLHEFLSNIMNDFIQRVNDKQGTFSLELKAQNYMVCVDEFHFANLLLNLVDNALKYCEIKPEISISTYSDKKNVYLLIKDKGIGIHKKYQKKIFKKFFRIPTGNVHNVKGFGLGLSYVRDIIKSHGWKYKLKSEINAGTEFTLILPLKDKTCE
ncbi:MAG TPA: sensor histidine kinase [Bacteroidales bacterium]|nr:sensor histidine kinase [Bacteroidales bacterium]